MITLSVFLMGADNGDQGGDERNTLIDQQKTLQARIEVLKAEQDFLLFQKEMYTADSKYLVLNFGRATGQFMYKNHVLKDFNIITPKNFTAGKLRTGILTLTKKKMGKNGRHTLVFGNALIMYGNGAKIVSQVAHVPSLFLEKKDMRSIFFSMEEGTMIYIMR